MDDLPIDINYAKMEEWLVDRRAVMKKKHPKEVERLIECAPILVQNVKYDIPALRKTLQRSVTVIEDADRRRQEVARVTAESNKNRKALLTDFGLAGDNLDEEVDAAIRAGVPKAVRDCYDVSQRLRPALEYFKEIHDAMFAATEEATGGAAPTKGAEGDGWEELAKQLFPTVCRILTAPPQLDSIAFKGGHDTAAGGGGAEAGGINWGDDFDMVADFTVVPEAGAATAAASEPKIDFGEFDDAAAMGFAVVEVGDTTLANESVRVQFLDELSALKAFLVEREREVCNKGSDGCGVRITTLGRPAAVTQYLQDVQATADVLQNKITSQLFRMYSSLRHKEKFIASINQMAYSVRKQEAMLQEASLRAAAAQEESSEARPKLDKIISETKELQKSCEEMLRKIFAPRQVYIVGEINSL